MLRVGVVSDTHAPRHWKQCPVQVARVLDQVDVILHAGDICVPSVLDELAAFAPVHAVRGNNDGLDVVAWGAAPETLLVDLDGVRVAMVHDSGPARGRLDRLRTEFPNADLVVFGHSHIPLVDGDETFTIFNPGSPTDKRRQPHRTMGLLTFDDSKIVETSIITVD